MTQLLYKIAEGLDVAPVVRQLLARPELWDQNPSRRVYENSPHAEMQDIWVRACAPSGAGLQPYSKPHESVWWPAADQLPALMPVIDTILRVVGAKRLGGVLVTKVPPGKSVLPHCDKGGWHADYYTTKVYVCLQGNEKCTVWCEGETAVMKSGEAWVFDNLVLHGLENDGDTDRISAIIATRC